jgi:hypothetical protein
MKANLDEAELTLPGLVLPKYPLTLMPACPFDVAKTDGSTVAVFLVLVCTVVANVTVVPPPPSDSVRALSVRKTSAKAGPGTGIVQVLDEVSHAMVVIFSCPTGRPSEEKMSPKVWPAQVKLYFWETEEARRYL